jgi:hypothetical protein
MPLVIDTDIAIHLRLPLATIDGRNFANVPAHSGMT